MLEDSCHTTDTCATTARITAGQRGPGAIPSLSTGLRPLVTNVVGVQTVVHFAGKAGSGSHAVGADFSTMTTIGMHQGVPSGGSWAAYPLRAPLVPHICHDERCAAMSLARRNRCYRASMLTLSEERLAVPN